MPDLSCMIFKSNVMVSLELILFIALLTTKHEWYVQVTHAGFFVSLVWVFGNTTVVVGCCHRFNGWFQYKKIFKILNIQHDKYVIYTNMVFRSCLAVVGPVLSQRSPSWPDTWGFLRQWVMSSQPNWRRKSCMWTARSWVQPLANTQRH